MIEIALIFNIELLFRFVSKYIPTISHIKLKIEKKGNLTKYLLYNSYILNIFH